MRLWFVKNERWQCNKYVTVLTLYGPLNRTIDDDAQNTAMVQGNFRHTWCWVYICTKSACYVAGERNKTISRTRSKYDIRRASIAVVCLHVYSHLSSLKALGVHAVQSPKSKHHVVRRESCQRTAVHTTSGVRKRGRGASCFVDVSCNDRSCLTEKETYVCVLVLM